MKKIIFVLILGCALTSLGCQSASDYTISKAWGSYFYKLHYDRAGNTATVVGEYKGDPKYDDYPKNVSVDSVIHYRESENEPFVDFRVIAVENLGINDEDLALYQGLRGYPPTHTIKLPASVKTIGELSMCDLKLLIRVEMPGVRTIGKEALSNNRNLYEPIVLRELEYLGEGAFRRCEKLQEIMFGAKLRFIGKDAFEGCENLRVVDMLNPNTWSRVEFETASANPIILTKYFNVYGNEVHHLDIDSRGASVSAYAFNSAENLRSVRILNANSIGESAFDRCINITDICLDADYIGNYAFGHNANIRRVYVMSDNPPKAHASSFFDYNSTKLYVPKGSLEAYRNSDSCWRFFLNIEESDFSEVDDIFRADYDIEDSASVESIEREERDADNVIDPTKPLEVYTMQGQLISRSVKGLTPGLYILRQGRKAKKVVIGHP